MEGNFGAGQLLDAESPEDDPAQAVPAELAHSLAGLCSAIESTCAQAYKARAARCHLQRGCRVRNEHIRPEFALVHRSGVHVRIGAAVAPSLSMASL